MPYGNGGDLFSFPISGKTIRPGGIQNFLAATPIFDRIHHMLRISIPSVLALVCLCLTLIGCATGANKDGLSGPSVDAPNEDYYGSGHRRIYTDTDEVNVGLGRYKKSF
jgi:hypothetical protein